jgi:hypothetical protein
MFRPIFILFYLISKKFNKKLILLLNYFLSPARLAGNMFQEKRTRIFLIPLKLIMIDSKFLLLLIGRPNALL